MDQLYALVPIALITAITELLKQFGLPVKYILPVVFILAILFAILATFNEGLTQTIVSILTYALGAVGLYKVGLSPFNTKKDETGNIGTGNTGIKGN